MKPEKATPTKRHLTDADRDNILRLLGCGLSVKETASIIHCSDSIVNYIRQAHTACINQDWSTLQRLSQNLRPTVDWAMKVTGTDKVFLETFPKDEPVEEAPKTEVVPEPAPTVVTREEFLALYASVQDIRNLLIDIRDTLK